MPDPYTNAATIIAPNTNIFLTLFIIFMAIIFFILFLGLLSTFLLIVPPGTAGVALHKGKIRPRRLPPGIHAVPWLAQTFLFPTTPREYRHTTQALTSDETLVDVEITYRLQVHPDHVTAIAYRLQKAGPSTDELRPWMQPQFINSIDAMIQTSISNVHFPRHPQRSHPARFRKAPRQRSPGEARKRCTPRPPQAPSLQACPGPHSHLLHPRLLA